MANLNNSDNTTEDTGTYDNTTEVSDNTTEDTGTCDDTTGVSDNTTENSDNNVPNLKREDTGTYDNTTEASDNTTVRKIYYYVLQLGQKDARLGYKS